MTGFGDTAQFLNNAFQGAMNLAKGQENLNNSNWKQISENNTAEVEAQIKQYASPEEYQAALKSGAIQSLMSGMGAQVDRKGIGQLMESRLATLQGQTKAQDEYKTWETNKADRDPLNQMKRLYLAGKTAEGDAFLKDTSWGNPAIAAEVAISSKGAFAKTDLEMALYPGTKDNALAKQRAETTSLNEATRLAEEQARERALEKRLQEETAKHLAKKELDGKPYGALADLNGIPTVNGIPDYGNMTKSDLAKMEFLSKSKGLPAYSSYARNDTKAGDSIYASIDASGEFPKDFVQKNRERIRNAANTVPFGGKVGDDRLARDTAIARTEAVMESKKDNTWYAPGSDNANNMFARIYKDIDSMDIPASNKKDIKRSLNGIASRGITLGNGTKVIPSYNDVIGAISTTTDGIGPDWMRGINDHGNNMYKSLKRSLSTPDSLERLKTSEELNAYTLKQEAKKILQAK